MRRALTALTRKSKLERLVKIINTEILTPNACTQKKQAAQIRRLQRLVGEAEARRRQWAKEAQQLRININQLKRRIEE